MNAKIPLASRGSGTDLPAAQHISREPRWASLVVCVSLAAIVWMVFGQTLNHGFVNYDDDLNVYENIGVVHGLNFRGLVWAFTHSTVGHWDPLTALTHMLDCQIYGLNPWGHHLSSVLLHTIAAILLFLLLRSMTSALWRSAFVAALFAIHPLRVESVAWVTERKDVLSGVFFLLTVTAYVHYTRYPQSVGRYVSVVLLFALGLMSKSMLVTLPFVLLLLDYWPLRRIADVQSAEPQLATWQAPASTIGGLLLEKLPLFILSALACVAQLIANREAIVPMAELPLSVRIGNAFVSYAVYMGQIFYPANLAALYPYPAHGWPLWISILAVMFIAVASVGAFLWRRRLPYIWVGWWWYFGMLMPVIGLVQSGLQTRADRYTYLPHIGLYLLLTWAIADATRGWPYRRLIVGSIASICIVGFSLAAHIQTSYWKSSESLWMRTLSVTSGNATAHNNLGSALTMNGRADEAMWHWQKAIEINPKYAAAHNNLGGAFFKSGKVKEAVDHWQEALAAQPDLAAAHNNLGNYYLQGGLVDEAIVHLNKALASQPDYGKAHNNFGNALLQKGQVDSAITHLQRALAIEPNNAEACKNLGNALLQKGQTNEAIAYFKKALAIRPEFAEAHYNLGNYLLQNGRVDEAIVDFQHALASRPDFLYAYNNLGAALLQKGQIGAAIVEFQKALGMQPDFMEAQSALARIAWLLATSSEPGVRDGTKALELAQRIDQLSGGNNPAIAAMLAAAYAETGRFPDAIATAQRAVQLANAQSNAVLAGDIQAHLKLYQAGVPFREPATLR